MKKKQHISTKTLLENTASLKRIKNQSYILLFKFIKLYHQPTRILSSPADGRLLPGLTLDSPMSFSPPFSGLFNTKNDGVVRAMH